MLDKIARDSFKNLISGITENDFMDFEQVRLSGSVNMCMTKDVCELSGLDREKVKLIRMCYAELSEKYSNVAKRNK